MARLTSSRVISRFLPATATTPRLLNPLMCWFDSAEMDRIDFDAGHQLGFLDRLLDRLHGRLEVDHDTALDATGLGHADPDDVERNRRRGCRRRPRRPSTCRCRGRPGTVLYASLFATRFFCRCRIGLLSRANEDAHPISQVNGIGVRNVLPECRRQIEIRLHSFGKARIADVEKRGIAFQHDDGVAGVRDIHLRRRVTPAPGCAADQTRRRAASSARDCSFAPTSSSPE